MTICSTLLFAACDGNGGSGNNKGDMAGGGGGGGGNFAVVSSTENEPVGSNCAMGGIRVNVGLDNGDGGGVARDGTLQTGEIDSTQYVCIEATPFPPVTRTTALPLGNEHCIYGGSQVDYGLDDGSNGGTPKNGILEDGEIDGTTYACLPMPGDLLVRTTELPPGDPSCAFGGQRIQSGLDDGAPTGTAGDSVLQDGEVDYTTTRCNPSPNDVFTNPTGAAGTAIIDVGGGSGFGSSAGPGAPGRFVAAVSGGPLATSLELVANGAAQPTMEPTLATFVAGDHPLTITTDVQIEASATEIAGPHLRGDPSAGVFALPLYDGANKVTSLDVTATGRVTFTSNRTRVGVRIEGAIRNAGRITVSPPVGEGEPVQPILILETNALFNEATGVIDSNGDAGNAGLFIAALFGDNGTIVNRGTITTTGSHREGETPHGAAPLQLVARGDIVNFGDVLAKGADHVGEDTESTSGDSIDVLTLGGTIYHYGTIDSTGGTGNGESTGGNIRIGTARGGFESLSDIEHPAFADAANYGPGELHATGAIRANGGASTADDGYYATTGGGGTIGIAIYGAIRATSEISATGGNVGAQYGYAGNGGNIYITALTWIPATGVGTFVVPSEIALSGSLRAHGSRSAGGSTGNYSGGNGGNIAVRLDAVLDGIAPNAPSADVDFDRNLLATSTVKPRVALYGYAEVNADAGDGADGVNAMGSGDPNVALRNTACINSTCNLLQVGERRIVLRTPIHVHGGKPEYSNSPGGRGGEVVLDLNNGNATVVNNGAALIDVGASIDVAGASSFGQGPGAGGAGGEITIQSAIANVRVQAGLDASGGNGEVIAFVDEGDNATGGGAGQITVNGFAISLESEVRLNGGIATLYGWSGELHVNGVDIKHTGEINASGEWGEGTLALHALRALDVGGKIVAQGRRSEFGYPTNGGSVDLTAATLTLSAAIDLDATMQATIATGGSGGKGGTLSSKSSILTFSGSLTAKGGGGGCSGDCSGGEGGEVSLVAPTIASTSAGTITLDGGSVTSTGAGDSRGGTGGHYDSSAPFGTATDNRATISARGGNATAAGSASATSGHGGFVWVSGNNYANVDARRGTATATVVLDGDAGIIRIDGSNSACLRAESLEPADVTNVCL